MNNTERAQAIESAEVLLASLREHESTSETLTALIALAEDMGFTVERDQSTYVLAIDARATVSSDKRVEDMTDDERSAAGIPTDYTVENLCVECGDDLDDSLVEIDGAPYGRPDKTVAVHAECYGGEIERD